AEYAHEIWKTRPVLLASPPAAAAPGPAPAASTA
ncbi:MAG: hypothetical protein RL722_71, partial [Pseudomonadota bacterium]